MPILELDDARLHYDVEGAGPPVFVIAPGGMHSANDYWLRSPWNPRAALTDDYTVIGMDQRNAGASTGAVRATDGWHTYAADQLAVLDHLGIESCQLLGMCIGGPYIFGLLNAAPARFTSAVLLQPVGIQDNMPLLRSMFDDWAAAIAPQHPEATTADWSSFGDNVWTGEFVVTATREQVAALETPLLVMMGNDQYHPQATSREIAAIAPHVTLVEQWKDAESLPATDATIKQFLAAHAQSN